MSASDSNYSQIPAKEIKKDVFRSIIYTDNLMMTIIDFKNGPWEQPEPFHSHPHEQLTYIAKGEIIFYCEGRKEEYLKEGDTFAVPSGEKHTIKVLSQEARLIDSFTPLREDFLDKAGEK